MTAAPLVSVVIVTYNSEAVIGDCLRSLARGVEPGVIETVLLDNASIDGGIELARTIDPSIIVIASAENLGFAKGVNLAAASATGEFILLLNPDATIDGDAVVALTSHMAPGVGIAAPLVEQDGGALTTLAVGRRPTIYRMFLHASGLGRLGARVPLLEGHHLYGGSVDRSRPRTVDWVSGGCLLIRRELWQQLDGLSTRWFMYAEDVELCLRVQRTGRSVLLVPTIAAQHAVGGSSHDVDGRMNTVWIENLYDLYCSSLAKSAMACALWKAVVVTGFRARQLAASVGRATPARARQRSRYRAYADALRSAPSTYRGRTA